LRRESRRSVARRCGLARPDPGEDRCGSEARCLQDTGPLLQAAPHAYQAPPPPLIPARTSPHPTLRRCPMRGPHRPRRRLQPAAARLQRHQAARPLSGAGGESFSGLLQCGAPRWGLARFISLRCAPHPPRNETGTRATRRLAAPNNLTRNTLLVAPARATKHNEPSRAGATSATRRRRHPAAARQQRHHSLASGAVSASHMAESSGAPCQVTLRAQALYCQTLASLSRVTWQHSIALTGRLGTSLDTTYPARSNRHPARCRRLGPSLRR
jgi:hypothetical protein